MPLLVAILSMVFVPSSHVEFRTNNRRTRYLGALIGREYYPPFHLRWTSHRDHVTNKGIAL
jgi:hypothetical protein